MQIHKANFGNAAIHATNLQAGLQRTLEHVFFMVLGGRPYTEHGGDPAKYFEVLDAYTVPTADVRYDVEWKSGMDACDQAREEGKQNGAMVTIAFQARPLSIEFCPFLPWDHAQNMGSMI